MMTNYEDKMKKLLLLLLLIPNLVMAEFDPTLPYEIIPDSKYQEWLDANPDKAGTEDYITIQKAANPNLNCKELDKKQKKEFRELCKRLSKEENIQAKKYEKEWRMHCAVVSGKAKSDFAAKKIYETCLHQGGVPKK